MALKALIDKVNRYAEFLEKFNVWYDAIGQKELDWILKVIKERITSTGEDASGDIIGTYSLFTASLNPEKAYNTPYTLDDTGGYWKQRFIFQTANAIITMSKSPSYREMLEQNWWSKDIERLNDSELEQLREIIKKNILNVVKEAWNK